MWGVGRRPWAIFLTAAVLAGCSAAEAQTPPVASAPAEVAQLEYGTHCAPFENNFQENAACQRADGTIDSFQKQSINWRVRYFVRYSEMPCGEEPTVDEAYVFQMVVGDLDRDRDLKDSERTAIRTALFDSKVRC